MTQIRIAEIFGPTIQGEGVLIGKPTVFVRTGGCDYRCAWCDSLHAVESRFRHEWKPMSVEAIWEEVTALSRNKPLTVSLSGGNPAIQPLGPLIEHGKKDGYRFALETQGSVAQGWFSALDTLVLSPKPPSSAMDIDFGPLAACIEAAESASRTVLKFVIFDDADYAFAKEVASRHPHLPVYLQPGNHTPSPPDGHDAAIDIEGIMRRMEWLVEKVIADGWYEAYVLPQLHVLIWGNKRGV